MNDNKPWYVYYFPEHDELGISRNIADSFSIYRGDCSGFDYVIAILIGEL